MWLDEGIPFRKGNVIELITHQWYCDTLLSDRLLIFEFGWWHRRILGVSLVELLGIRGLLYIRTVELGSDMVIRVLYGFEDWEFS